MLSETTKSIIRSRLGGTSNTSNARQGQQFHPLRCQRTVPTHLKRVAGAIEAHLKALTTCGRATTRTPHRTSNARQGPQTRTSKHFDGVAGPTQAHLKAPRRCGRANRSTPQTILKVWQSPGKQTTQAHPRCRRGSAFTSRRPTGVARQHSRPPSISSSTRQVQQKHTS